MSEFKGGINRRQLLKMASPLGKVTMEKSGCTGCGLCALDCPTGALTVSVSEEVDVYQLLFKHNLCVACGQCVKVCPEQCLHLERTLKLDELNRPATILFKDEIVKCPECGNPVGSKALIDSIRTKIMASGQLSARQVELCPDCKAKAQFTGLKSK